MKSSRQPKRKVSVVPQQHNKCTGSGIKKPINRVADKCQKAVLGGKDTIGAPQLSSTKLPNGGIPQPTKIPESDLQTGQNNHSRKIKLQLFPLSESMRLQLEKDGYNPFLELTLSVKKKISSVIKHLNTKWGSSVVAKGELMLFPFNVLLENLASYSRWTQNNSYITAGEVHVAIGSPAVFRLRYGWISSNPFQKVAVPYQSCPVGASSESQSNRKGCNAFLESRCGRIEELEVTREESPKLININEATTAAVNDQFPSDTAVVHMGDDAKTDDGPVQTLFPWDDLTNLSIGGLLSESSLQGKISIPNAKPEINSCLQTSRLMSELSRGGETLLKSKTKDSDQYMQKEAGDTKLQPIQLEPEISIGGLLSEASLQGKNISCDLTTNKNKTPLSLSSWEDNLTTLSIGGLLSEASLQGKINSSDPKLSGSKFSSQEAPPISDSFDAFIFAQLNSNPEGSKSLLNDSHPHSSILDAEETCHAFTFGKVSTSSKDPSTSSRGPGSGGCNNYSSIKPFKYSETVENGVSLHAQDPFQQPKDMPRPRGIYEEDSSLGLSGIKWNDSLGPFDLGLPTSRSLVNSGDSFSISEFVR